MADKIILIGFMGSGKTSVGKLIAKRYQGYKFIDSDEEIESIAGKSINEIFEDEGEEGFRRRERGFLIRLCDTSDKIILSTGGGMPCYKGNDELLKKAGFTVYLSAKPETIYNRVKNDTTRPLLNVEDKLAKIKELLSIRDELYRKAAKVIIETDGKHLNDIVDEIMGNE
ncbi:MAG: shikimate kinase [Lachnospiraceae bacterium]|nr:shikimate kinase [Lachnospiraceae bacterium]